MKYAWQIGFGEHRAGRSSEPLHKSSLKFLSLWLWLYGETQWEGQTEKEEYNDFWLQRQKKPCIIYWNIITKYCTISVLKKKNTQRNEHLVTLFTNVTVCLSVIQCDIFFTWKLASAYNPPSICENARQVLSKQTIFKYIFRKNSNNFHDFSPLQTKKAHRRDKHSLVDKPC